MGWHVIKIHHLDYQVTSILTDSSPATDFRENLKYQLPHNSPLNDFIIPRQAVYPCKLYNLEHYAGTNKIFLLLKMLSRKVKTLCYCVMLTLKDKSEKFISKYILDKISN